MTPVELPKANENLTEATLDHWLVQEGQSVLKDQGLCQIITDKATFEMPAPAAGTVLKLLGPERAVLPVGYVLCVLGAAGEAVPVAELSARNDALLAAHRSAATTVAGEPGVSGAAGPAVPVAASGTRATPAARRIAREAGLDLAQIARKYNLSGPVGEKDVKRFLEDRT